MQVNGKEVQLKQETILKTFLEQQSYDLARIAVEKNGQIIAKELYATELLSNDDKLEVVAFVGGG